MSHFFPCPWFVHYEGSPGIYCEVIDSIEEIKRR